MHDTKEIKFFVAGIPAPKGSTKSFPFRRKSGGLGVSTFNDNPKTVDWQQRIATEAQAANVPCADQAIEIALHFQLPRPKRLKTKKWAARTVPHTTKPDLDKLVRAALDALQGIMYTDDSQVCAIHTTKWYVKGSGSCGVQVHVWPTDPWEE